MAKIMLVEDDKSLREIYGIRLVAEGYEVVSAGDGEEALALAVQSRPDLVISDVMMPKISGFDMLDILRSTPETKDIKVIMMTALSSEDQRQRGEALGADKYLVKSQVGIEDVINAVHEVLNDKAIGGNTVSEAASSSADAPLAQRTESASRSDAPASSNPSSDSALRGGAPAEAPAEAPSTLQGGVPAEAPSTLQGGAPAEAGIPTVPAVAPAASPTPVTSTPEAPTPVTAPVPGAPTSATTQAPGAPTPAVPQNSTAEAMEQLLNSTPDAPNATWPGNAAK